MTDQQLRSFMQTKEAMQCPYGVISKPQNAPAAAERTKKEREKQTETESLNVNLTSIFEDFDSGSNNNAVDFD